MATLLAALRSFSCTLLPCVALTATLTGCFGGDGDISFEDPEAELGGDEEAEGNAGNEAETLPGEEPVVELGGEGTESAACEKSATFTFSNAGDTTIASIDGQSVAWFTKGSYSVRMEGPSRSFGAGSTVVPGVHTSAWIRTMSAPFDPATTSDATLAAWLDAARAKNCAAGTKDVLAIAYEYVDGASKDARYALGADFHDYLGVSWDPLDGKSLVAADVEQLGALDCSGYMRLVWGSRASLPLSLKPLAGHLPRTSEEMYRFGPGKLVVPFRTQPAGAPAFQGAPTESELAAIKPGDLVFFDTDCHYGASTLACGKDPSVIGHVGMFVGRDTSGNSRFISSRATADGPTVGNTGGWSIFNAGADASGTYPQRFRAARRL